jgi:archaeal flagellar protein FlaH
MTTEQYSLGLEKVDRVSQSFGGGLPKGSVVLLEGGHGSGKSVLTQRFAYGLASEGTTVAYVSTDHSAAGFLSQMESLSYDAVDLLLSERLLFLQADVDTHERDEEGRLRGERDLLSGLLRPSVLWRADVVIVDELSALLRNDPAFDASIGEEEADHAMQRVVSRLSRATSAGKTVVLTVDPSAVGEEPLRPLETVADVYLELRTKAVGQDLRKSALVRRFAGMAHPIEDTIGFSVQQGRGVIIESRTVA